jgi:hypothetical protein
MSKPNGGSAYPDHIDLRNTEIEDYPGMSLRDYFAGQALVGIVSVLHDGVRPIDLSIVAVDSYLFADAMIAERNK